MPQPRAGAGNDRHNQSSPWPDLVRPPTSWREAVWTTGKPWMTGTSPVKGMRSCSRVAANNQLRSTGQPWVAPGHDDQRRPAHPPCHYSNIIGAHHQHPKLLSVRNSAMSIWTLIVLGRAASAALRGVVRRWCRAVAWRSRHREHCEPKIPLPVPLSIPLSTAENSAAARLSQTHPGP